MLRLLLLTITLVQAHPGHAWDPDGPLEITVSHPAFAEQDGVLLLGSKPFTGVTLGEFEVSHPLLVASDIPNSILISRICYQDGLKHGTSYHWHPNGFMKAAFHYTKGILSGIQQEWHANGRPKSKMDYIMGTPYGLEQHWDEDGQVVKEVIHDPIPEE